MISPVAFLGTNGGVCFSSEGFASALNTIGMNTGNMLFQFALWSHVKRPKYMVWPGSDWSHLRGQFSALVIPSANQVNPDWDLADWAAVIEQLDCPVVIAGLGAQADVHASPDLVLQPGTQRFIHLLAERASLIGVRGAYTQSVLAHHGVTNTAVLGCPSQFINPHITGASIQTALTRARIRPNDKAAHLFGTMEPDTRAAEKVLFGMGQQLGADIVYQTNSGVLRLIYDRTLDEETQTYLEWEREHVAPLLSLPEYTARVARKGRMFSDARTWIDAMTSYDVAFGMRIHGAVAAIQAGTAGICVTFDSRTKELVESMAYPWLPHAEITEAMGFNALLDCVRFDADRFDTTKERNLQIYRSLFDSIDI